jgi:hypothetical protein
MTPIRYRWDVYGDRKAPGPWISFKSWPMFGRALRALRMPQERLRVQYDNGQQVVVRPRHRSFTY